jgi:hypothetical protein
MRFLQTTLGITALVLICGTGTALASTSIVLKANVPFGFEVNGHSMPAGTYLIQRDDNSPSVLVIRGANQGNHSVALVTTQPDNGRDPAGAHAAVTFTRYENDYRLASVWQSQGDGFDITAVDAGARATHGSLRK